MTLNVCSVKQSRCDWCLGNNFLGRPFVGVGAVQMFCVCSAIRSAFSLQV